MNATALREKLRWSCLRPKCGARKENESGDADWQYYYVIFMTPNVNLNVKAARPLAFSSFYSILP